jgi:hypothetical protein
MSKCEADVTCRQHLPAALKSLIDSLPEESRSRVAADVRHVLKDMALCIDNDGTD